MKVQLNRLLNMIRMLLSVLFLFKLFDFEKLLAKSAEPLLKNIEIFFGLPFYRDYCKVDETLIREI